jgi:hypothetical protein
MLQAGHGLLDTSGALCGGPTLTEDVTPSPSGFWPEPMVALGERYQFGARCHLDGRFLAEVTALLGWATLGTFRMDESDPTTELPYITGPTVAAVVGACKRHGWVEAEYDHIEWGDFDA